MREHVTVGDFALLVGIVLLLTVIFAMPARAACPGGVCPLPRISGWSKAVSAHTKSFVSVPRVTKGEVSVVASRAIQPIRCPRELTCKPKCHKRFSGVVRRVVCRVRGR